MLNGFVSWLMSPAASIMTGSLFHRLAMVVAGVATGYYVHKRSHGNWTHAIAAGAGAAYVTSLLLNAAQVFSQAPRNLLASGAATATNALNAAASTVAPVVAPVVESIPSVAASTVGAATAAVAENIPSLRKVDRDMSKYVDDDSSDQGIFGDQPSF